MQVGTALWAASLLPPHSFAQDIPADFLHYRGFSVDISAARHKDEFEAIVMSLRRQIDIVADCGAKPEIIDFFRDRRIRLDDIPGAEPGRFVPRRGVEIDSAPQPSNKPILLHELLHAFHALAMPGGVENSDILRFYDVARRWHRYRANSYVLKNPKEYFAVTGSVYLWGIVNRAPFTRERLKERQPIYYVWLGRLFGVQK
ncbi:MAG: hypothetical protein ACREHF_08215 [Rhizomicrobium sp.]